MQIEIDINAKETFAVQQSLLGGLDSNVEVPGGAVIESHSMQLHESVDATDIIILVVSFLGSTALPVGVNLFSSWLYDKLKRVGAKKLRVEKREVRIEKEEIEWAVGEAVKVSRTVSTSTETIRIEE